MALLTVEGLRTSFHTRNGIVRAVNDVSYHIAAGETLGLVGESGSGKSVSVYSLLGLIPTPPGRIDGGSALFDGSDLLQVSPAELRRIRGRRIAMIFQDPMTCLNPYMRIGRQVMEPLLIHRRIDKREAYAKALQALRDVGIPQAEQRMRQYPHEFSGGMRQRVMIAMALVNEPDLLIADEPTTALDVTVQAQIIDLIKKLQEDKGTAVIFITHDLGVIAGVADRVLVMYAGRIVECGPTAAVFGAPSHPYTRALLESIPGTHEPGDTLRSIPGLPPNLALTIPGCAFAPRCSQREPICEQQRPQLKTVAPDHASACLPAQEGRL